MLNTFGNLVLKELWKLNNQRGHTAKEQTWAQITQLQRLRWGINWIDWREAAKLREKWALVLMDATGIKSLNIATPFHFRPKACLFRPFSLVQLKNTLHLSLSSPRLSPLCSLSNPPFLTLSPLACTVISVLFKILSGYVALCGTNHCKVVYWQMDQLRQAGKVVCHRVLAREWAKHRAPSFFRLF